MTPQVLRELSIARYAAALRRPRCSLSQSTHKPTLQSWLRCRSVSRVHGAANIVHSDPAALSPIGAGWWGRLGRARPVCFRRRSAEGVDGPGAASAIFSQPPTPQLSLLRVARNRSAESMALALRAQRPYASTAVAGVGVRDVDGRYSAGVHTQPHCRVRVEDLVWAIDCVVRCAYVTVACQWALSHRRAPRRSRRGAASYADHRRLVDRVDQGRLRREARETRGAVFDSDASGGGGVGHCSQIGGVAFQ
jgi:hypothetical protein